MWIIFNDSRQKLHKIGIKYRIAWNGNALNLEKSRKIHILTRSVILTTFNEMQFVIRNDHFQMECHFFLSKMPNRSDECIRVHIHKKISVDRKLYVCFVTVFVDVFIALLRSPI